MLPFHTLRFNLALGLALVAFPFCGHAQDATIPSLLSSGRYSEAGQQARNTPANQVVFQVRDPARKNSTAAQWLLADAYWRMGQKQMSVEWGYVALVATEMDASGCQYPGKVVPWMMQAYQEIFREASRRPDLQSRALELALNRQARNPLSSDDQAWACRLGAQLSGKKSPNASDLVGDKVRERRRVKALENLIRKSGLKITINDNSVH